MNNENKPDIINCAEDIFKCYFLCRGNKFYVTNLVSPKMVEDFIELIGNNVEITYFDHRELDE